MTNMDKVVPFFQTVVHETASEILGLGATGGECALSASACMVGSGEILQIWGMFLAFAAVGWQARHPAGY